MITVRCPNHARSEHEYIFHVLLHVYLGLEYRIEFSGTDNISLQLPNGTDITCAGNILSSLDQSWLDDNSLNALSVHWMKTDTLPIPVRTHAQQFPVFSLQDTPHTITHNNNKISITADLIGSSFLMLSRYEEALDNAPRDKHGRAAAANSIADKNNFLHVPVVNIYLEVLWGCMAALCPALKRKANTFTIMPTHDVDAPYESMFIGLTQALRQSASLTVKRRAPVKAANNMIAWLTCQAGKPLLDSYDTFSLLMDASEKAGTRSHFYFKTGKTDAEFDKYYDPAAPSVRALMQAIHKRGHHIGFHPSYNTSNNAEEFNTEYKTLRNICDDLGIQQTQWGGRQHFLKWNARTSPAMWNTQKLSYDSTLSYADKPGFRCGTCYAFPLYDLTGRKTLTTYERPLIVMEQSVLNYMNLSGDLQQAWDVFASLKSTCKFYGGEYVLLWHNSQLPSAELKTFYRDIVEGK